MDINNLTEFFNNYNISVILRLVTAVFVGGVIGMEREHKHRPAGFRTHILICLGSALTALTGQFLCTEFGADTASVDWSCDPLRLSAQVVAGIGFMGAGSIIVTKRSQVKGLTTAAGLWTTAILGIAIGVGFYSAVLYATALILVAEILLSKLEYALAAKARRITLYVEYGENINIASVMDVIKVKNVNILDIEVAKTGDADVKRTSAILTLQFNGKSVFEEITTELARMKGIYSVQEL